MSVWAEQALALAGALGWPSGVTLWHGDERIAVPGGEAGWRAWVSGKEDSDVLTTGYFVLQWAMRVMRKGRDPGPPETWGQKERLAIDAENGMEAEEE
jgi:hypothetical protein